MSRGGKPWLRLEMSRQDAETFLYVQPVGSFIIRTSSHRGNFALSVKYPQGSKNMIHNVVIVANLMPSGASYQLQASQFSFKSLDELVKHYSNKMTDPTTLSQFLISEFSQGGAKSAPTQTKLEREHVGQRVTVEGYTVGGTLMFVGEHHKSGKKKAGVRLDKPVGMNNGVVSGHKYFRCDADHGILVVPKKVTLVDPKAATKQISQRRSVRASSMKAAPRSRLLSTDSVGSTGSLGARRNSVGSTRSRHSSIGSIGSAGDTNPDEIAPSISHKPWFVGMVASNEAKLKVQKSGKDGDFVIRESASTANSYVIVCNVRKTVKEFKILYSNGKYRFSGNPDQSNNFETMDMLLTKVDEARRPAKELCQYLARKPSMSKQGSSSSLTTSPRASVVGGHTGPIRFTPIDLPKDFGLDDEPWFAGPLYESHIDEVLRRGARGSYVVSDTVNGDYLLTVLENKRDGSLAHHNILRQGGAYKLDLNNKLYVTINDAVNDLPKCKSAARKLFEPSYVPKTNTRPRVASVSSVRSTSTAPDEEDFGGFGDDEEDQLYMNDDVVPRGPPPVTSRTALPDEEEDQLYMNDDVIQSNTQMSPKLPPPPLATMLPDGSSLPPEESEDLYADEDDEPAMPPPPPASRSPPPPLATMLPNGNVLPPEDNEDMYEDVSDDEPPMPSSTSRPSSRTPPPLAMMLPNGTALPPEDNEDMYEDVSDDEPPMPPSSSRPPPPSTSRPSSRTPPPLTTMLPNGNVLPPEDDEDVYDDGDPVEDDKPLPPPPPTTSRSPTQSHTLLPDGTSLPQEESEDMYEDPDDEPPVSSSSSLPPPPLAPSRTILPTGQELPPEDEEEMYMNEEVLMPPQKRVPPPPLAVVTTPSQTLLPGGDVLPDEEDDEVYEYANDEPKTASPPPTAPRVDDDWSDSDVDLDAEDPYADPASEEEDFGGFGG
eukprot:m.63771 g.63771  ORF g.63771 m.63771 type:complete len:937 (+) comp23341_c0_seq1:50-2860(+)